MNNTTQMENDLNDKIKPHLIKKLFHNGSPMMDVLASFIFNNKLYCVGPYYPIDKTALSAPGVAMHAIAIKDGKLITADGVTVHYEIPDDEIIISHWGCPDDVPFDIDWLRNVEWEPGVRVKPGSINLDGICTADADDYITWDELSKWRYMGRNDTEWKDCIINFNFETL